MPIAPRWIALLVLALRTAAAPGQIWTGATSANWNVASNWSPGLPVSGINTALTFGAPGAALTLNQNLGNPFQLNSITFTSAASNYLINGNALTFSTNFGSVGPQIVWDYNGTVALTTPLMLTDPFTISGIGTGQLSLTGAITGTGGLTVNTAGIVRLTNSANAFVGDVRVDGGALLLGGGQALPDNVDVTVTAGGTFSTGGLSNTLATAIGEVTLNGGTFAIPNGSGNYYVNELLMNAAGTVDFTGATNSTLHLTGTAAGVTIGGNNAAWIGGGTSRIVNDTAAPLDIDLNSQTFNSSVRLANGSAGQGFRLNGPGTMVLSNTGNTADLIVDERANLLVEDVAFLGTGNLTLANSTALNLPGTLQYTGPTATSTKAITLGANGGQIWIDNDTGTNLTLTDVIDESVPGAGLRVRGHGSFGISPTLTLTAANTYTGPTIIGDDAILSIGTIANGGVASPLGASSADPANLVLGDPVNSNPGRLRYTGPTATTNRGMTFGINALIDVAEVGTNLTVTGQLTGNGPLIKTGPGTLTLTSTDNDFAVGAFVNAGRLRIGAAGEVLPAGSFVQVSSGAAFEVAASSNFSTNPLGRFILLDGTFAALAGSSSLYLNRLETGNSGGTVDLSANPSNFSLRFDGAGAGIAVNGDSTWIAGGGFQQLLNDSFEDLDLAVAAGVTLTNGLRIDSDFPGVGFRLTGGGTLFQTAPISGLFEVHEARLRIDSVGVIGDEGLKLNAGTLRYDGPTASIDRPFVFAFDGGTIHVGDPAATLTLSAALTGSGPLVKAGPGVLRLTDPDNTFAGGVTVSRGRLDVGNDAALGPGDLTVNPLGTLRFTNSLTTARTIHLLNGSAEVPSGVTLTMNGATVGGGFLRGNGTYNLGGGTSLTGVTTFTNTNLNITGPASITNFSHNGNLTVNPGQTLAMNYGTNGSAGRITVNGTMNVSEFVSNGFLSVPAGGLINNTGSNMVLGGGSTTFVGSVANPGGKIDLGGQQLLVRGGLLVTNGGSFGSGNGVRNGVTVADYGALVKGTGPYDSVITQNGGQFLPGNSPGTSQVGTFNINGGGGLIFQITDAGPSVTFPTAPGLPGTNPGWGLTQVFTALNFTATPASPFTITMQTQLPPPAAPDTPGAMSSFDPNQAYQWLIFDLQPGAAFNGTFDPLAINFATAQFVNSTMGGSFSLARNGGQIFLTFTPVPEPEHIVALAMCGLVGGGAYRRWRHSSPRPG
jgi:autotransporter-associated beta strand protein